VGWGGGGGGWGVGGGVLGGGGGGGGGLRRRFGVGNIPKEGRWPLGDDQNSFRGRRRGRKAE